MTRNARLGFLGAAVVVIVVAALLIGFGGDNGTDTAQAPTATATATAAPGRTGGAAAEPAATATPVAVQRIEVEGGEPVGGVQTIEVDKGETVRYTVTSDAPVEIHTHGYDIAEDAAPGAPARFAFKAANDGIYEVEVEDTGTEIAKLRVNP